MRQHRGRSLVVILVAALTCTAGVAAAGPAIGSAADADPAFAPARPGPVGAVAKLRSPVQAGVAWPLAASPLNNLVSQPSQDATAQDTQSGTSVLVAGPNLIAAYNDSGSAVSDPRHFTGYAVSTNGGTSWTDKGALPDSVEGDGGDPVLARDAVSGRVYLATLGSVTGTNIQVFASDDDGTTFGAPVNATPGFGSTQALQDKPWITVDNYPGPGQGTIYLAWRQFYGPHEGVKFVSSTDHGLTWGPSQGTVILAADGQGTQVVVTPDHCVSVFYLDLNVTNNYLVRTRKSCDGGTTFGTPVTVTTLVTTGTNGDLHLKGSFLTNSFPTVTVNPVTGAMYLVYNDLTASSGSDVFLSTSTNGGTTWSTPVTVNTDGGPNDQFFPTVAVRSDGKMLMFGWYDRRNDPINLDMQRWGRTALVDTATNAISYRGDFQMSASFPVVVGQDPAINTKYMGEYDQIAADATTFYSVWSDNRNPDAFNANQPDVRFARVGITAKTDVAVSVTDSADPVPLAGSYSYTVSVSNPSAATANNVYLNNQLPLNVKFKSVSTSAGSCFRLNFTVSCALPSIAAGAIATVTITVAVVTAGTGVETSSITVAAPQVSTTNDLATASTTLTDAPVVSQTFSTGSIATTIPDLSSVDIPLTVSAPAKVALDVNVTVRLDHTFDTDLVITLISPSGKQVVLVRNRGDGGDDFGTGANSCAGSPTTFDDSAAITVAASAPPYIDPVQPEQSLFELAGVGYVGTWTLHITDDSAGDTGTVGCVSLVVKHRT